MRVLKGGRRWLIGGVIVLAASCFALQRQVAPTWKTATQAEIDRVIDPSLLAPINADPVQQARYGRLQAAFKKIPGATEDALAGGEAEFGKNFLAQNGAAIHEVGSILNEGPFQHPIGGGAAMNFPTFAGSKSFVKSISAAARGLAAAGRDREAVDLVRLGVQFVDADGKAANSMIDYFVCVAEQAIIYRAASDLAESEKLSTPSLEALLASVRDPKDESEEIARAVRCEFRTQVYPLFVDPIKGFEAWIPPEWKSKSKEAKPASTPPGNYDPIATARRASQIEMLKLQNLVRPLNQVDTSLEKALQHDLDALPNDPSDNGATPTQAELWSYNARLARIPNSYGLTLVSATGIDSKSLVGVRSKAESERNLVRTEIALAVFQRRHGHLPGTLLDLVRPDLLAELPKDGFSGNELRYDPKRRLIWSVNENLVDDGGKYSKLRNAIGPDIVYSVPKT